MIKQSNIKKYLIFYLPCYINKSAVRVPSVGTNLEIYKLKQLLTKKSRMEKICKRCYLKMKKKQMRNKNNSMTCFSFICKAYKTQERGNTLKRRCDEFGLAPGHWM